MNSDYKIYHASEEEIPAEDKARLEGYLRGREDEVKLDALEARLKAIQDREDRIH